LSSCFEGCKLSEKRRFGFRERDRKKKESEAAMNLEMIPETENETAVRNHRMFVRESERWAPGRLKSNMDGQREAWRLVAYDSGESKRMGHRSMRGKAADAG
jgi:hypothetical protein